MKSEAVCKKCGLYKLLTATKNSNYRFNKEEGLQWHRDLNRAELQKGLTIVACALCVFELEHMMSETT